MGVEIIIYENKETARWNRLQKAFSTLLEQLQSEEIKVKEESVIFSVEQIPPAYTDEAIGHMALEGVRVITTDYSQHIFVLVGDRDDRL